MSSLKISMCVMVAGLVAGGIAAEGPKLPAPGEVVVRQVVQSQPGEPARVDGYPIGFAVVPGLQFPGSEMDVDWFRFNLLLGSHRRVGGIDIGVLANMSDTDSACFSLASLYNYAGYSSGGFHLAGLFDFSEKNFSGLQFAAAFCYCDGAMKGMQLSVCNICEQLTGLQLGVFNLAVQGAGMQFGLVNSAERLAGLQFGLLNLNLDSTVPVLPIVNMAF